MAAHGLAPDAHGRLAGAIGGCAGKAPEGGERADDGDLAAAAIANARDRRVQGVEHAAQVGGEDGARLLGRFRAAAGSGGYARVGDHQLQRHGPIRLGHPRGRGLAVVHVECAGVDGCARAPHRFGKLFEVLGVAPAQEEGYSRRRVGACQRRPDAAGGTRQKIEL